MIEKEPHGSEAYKRGIRGYTENVGKCRWCDKPCNTFWSDSKEILRPVFACCQFCADRIAEKTLNRR